MQTLFKFVVLFVGGLLVLSGCASADVSPSTSVESIPEATSTQEQMTESESEDVDSQVQSVETEEDTVQPQSDEVTATGYVFYDSYADW